MNYKSELTLEQVYQNILNTRFVDAPREFLRHDGRGPEYGTWRCMVHSPSNIMVSYIPYSPEDNPSISRGFSMTFHDIEDFTTWALTTA